MFKPKRTPALLTMLLSRLRQRGFVVVAFLVLFLLVLPLFSFTRVNTAHVYAASADNLNFQARLQTAGGAIVSDGYYNLEFKLYSDLTGGSALWTEAYTGANKVRVVHGYVSVYLGSLDDFPGDMPWDQQLYLTMNVGGTDVTPNWDGEMTPRLKLTAVPYAMRSNVAKQLETTDTGSGNTATLSIQAPVSGDQTFVLQDQGAAGTYNIVTDGNATTILGSSFIQNQNSSNQTADFRISGTGQAAALVATTSLTTPLVDTVAATALNIGTTNATSINLNQNTVLGAGKSITITGGNTASRPGSPSEGMMYYDTDTKQLLFYANGKWQGDRSTATKIVAASNASQAVRDSADYVATGTSDQTVINAALIAAAGGKVYLTEGTYTIDASISVPNDTTLEGAGNGTVITIPNALNTNINMITNADTSTGTGVIIRNLAVDGNRANQTTGTMSGIFLDYSGGSNRKGSTVTNNTVYNLRSAGIGTENSYFNTFTGNTVYNNVDYNIVVGTNSYNNVISNNVTYGTLSHNIYLGLGGNNTVTGNTVRGGPYGISVASGSLTRDNAITGNTLYGNTVAAIAFNVANYNIVSDNTIYNSGGSAANNAIQLTTNADNNTITGNTIVDTSCTTTCYAINIVDNTSSNNYLADNVFSSTPGNSTINDLGAGTIYANQSRAENGAKLTARTANDTEAFAIQNASGLNILTVDTTNDQVVLGNSTTAGTINISAGNGYSATITPAVFTADRKFILPDTSLATTASPATICVFNGTTSNCPAATGSAYYLWNSTSVQNAANYYLRSASASEAVGVLEGAAGQTADLLSLNNFDGTNSTTVARITSAGNLQVAGSIDTTTSTVLNIGTTNATSINLNQNTVLAAGKTITVTGGNTASRPASPTEGMIYYDTTTKQLLVYANGKWQGDRSTATKIVAASNSSQAVKDAADYIADGTGDQVEINAALTAAVGGKVYLAEGTYTIDASISIPNNTTLAGAGAGTVITIPNGLNTNISAIINTTTGGNGTGVAVQDLKLDGNAANQTAGTMHGVYFNGVGSGTGSSAVQGGKIANVTANNWNNGIFLSASSNNVVTGNITQGNINRGFNLNSNANNNTLIGNLAIGNTGYGFNVNSSANNTLTGNTAQGNVGSGFYLNTANGNTVTGNTSQGGINHGFYLGSSSYNTVTGNTARGNAMSGINLNGSTYNTVSSNKLHDNGGPTNNNGAHVISSSNNSIIGNNITDTSYTATNYAINITDNTSNNNYLADNTLDGGTINDLGTGTVYGGQSNGTAYLIQPTTNVIIGSASTTTTIQGTLSITPQTSTSTTLLCSNGGVVSTCDSSVVVPTAANFIQNTTIQQTGNFNISGTGIASILQAGTFDTNTAALLSLGTTNATSITLGKSGVATTVAGGLLTSTIDAASVTTLNIGTTTATSINLNQNTVLAAGKTITVTGGNTASRPASPTEGMIYYDTTTKQLLVYANGKWQGDRSTATKIVAASNSPQAVKDAADYVADGTADQTEINAALTAAAGGKVYLAEGTYTINASISIPNNTTLAGAGAGTVITIPNSFNSSINAITNTTTGGNGTGITIQDIRLDGNKAHQTSGSMSGIYFNGVGSGTNIPGGKITNVIASNWRSMGIYLYSSSNNTITGNTTQDNTGNGILVVGSSNNTITGNTTQDNTGNGIYLYSSSNNTITGNTASGRDIGIYLDSSSNNTISGNNLSNNGDTTTNNAIYLYASDSNTITGNTITDTSATITNYAINITNSTSDTNYLADNTLGGSTIYDGGTGTIYGGQSNGTSFLIQPATYITIGSASTTTTIQGNTAVTLNGTAGTTMVCRNASGYLSVCDSSLLAPTATNFIQNQNASAQTGNYWISGTARANTSVLTPALDTATGVALNIGTTNATSINLGQNTTVASGRNFTVTNGTTSLTGTVNVNTSGTATTTIGNATATNVIAGTTGITGATTVTGATSINTSGGATTTIGNSGATNAIVGTSTITGATSINTTGSANTSIGNGSTGTVTIGNGSTGAVAIQSGTSIGLTGITTVTGNTSINTTGAGTTTIGSTSGGAVNVTGASAISLQTAASGIITVGSQAAANTVNIGTVGAAAFASTVNIATSTGAVQTVTIGSTNGASATTIRAGSGGIALNAATISTNAATLSLFNATATTVTAFQASNAISLGATTGTFTVRNANTTLGNAAGSGTFTNNGSTKNTTLALGNLGTGAIGTAAATVDVYTSFTIAPTASGRTYTIPAPTDGAAGRTIYISNIHASSTFTIGSTTFNAHSTATLVYDGTSWNFAGMDGGSNNYIQNQTASAQSAGFNISGAGTLGGLLTASAGATIAGTTSITGATSINTTGAATTTIGNGSAGAIGLVSGAAVTMTAGAASTWSTTTGLLTVQGGGGLSLLTANAATSSAITIQSGNSTSGTAASVNIDTGTSSTGAGTVNIGVTNAGTVNIGRATGTANIVSNTINVGSATAATILQGMAQTTSDTAGTQLTVRASAGNGTGNGGNLVLSGGVAGGGGSSVMGVVSLSPTVFSGIAAQTLGTTQTLTQSWIDTYSTLPLIASASGLTFTVPSPTINSVGRVFYVSNAGVNDFTLVLGGTGISLALKANSTATLIWNGTGGGNGWTAAGASSSTDLQSAYNNTLTSAGGAELVLNAPGGNADGLTIRNNGVPITGALFEVQSSIATNLFSVNSNTTEYAVNGGVENATFTGWTALTSTVTQNTNATHVATGRASVSVGTTGNNQGVRNALSTTLTTNTNYVVSFAAKLGGSLTSNTLNIYYSVNGTAQSVPCNTSLPNTGYPVSPTFTIKDTWTKVSCFVTTPGAGITSSNAILIYETDFGAGAKTFYVDNLSVISNASGTTPANVQIGGGATGGQPTLFTLDQFAGPPMGAGNDAYLGSMYYDTTKGTIQCYQSNGWGACGSAPDDIVSMTPEYTGAVLNGSGVGTMTADFCGNGGGLSVNTGFCASGEARNYYKWTSPQPTAQAYSIYVTYRLPSTFKTFVNGTTSLTGLVDNTTNAGVSYAIYRKANGGGLTSCSASKTVVGSGSGSINTWTTEGPTTDPSACTDFVAGDSIVFQITVTARSNASAYVENLTFQYSNK